MKIKLCPLVCRDIFVTTSLFTNIDFDFPKLQTRANSNLSTSQVLSYLVSMDATSHIPQIDPHPNNGTICWLEGIWT